MANIFKPKRSSTSSSVPTTGQLVDGELAVNSADKIIYLRDGGSIIGVANYSTIDRAVGITVDGGGSVLTTGTKGYIEVPYSGTIIEWKIIADVSGSVVFDVWKLNAAIPTNSNSITASAKPTLTSSQRATSTTLTGWTTGVSANDVFAFEIESATTVTKATLTLVIRQN